MPSKQYALQCKVQKFETNDNLFLAIFQVKEKDKFNMLSTQEAINLIFNNVATFSECLKKENTSFSQINKLSILENIKADRGYPPFHRVAMDGIAIQEKSFKNGIRDFPIEGIQKAGEPLKELMEENSCFEVMTGAILPKNTDVVIPYEQVQIKNNLANINIDKVNYLQNVHQKNSDYKINDILIEKHEIITPPRIGILASVGKNQIHTKTLPKIAIISTGDELVDIDDTPEIHQIRKSNVYAIESLLHTFGFYNTKLFHIKDNIEMLEKELKNILENFDCLILSGGVSMGKFDFTPKVLRNLQVEEIFYKVAQKPGKPLWFGTSNKKQLVFGLPGNPISALVCARYYVLPALVKASGSKKQITLKGMLTEKIDFKKNFTFFHPITVTINNQAQILAQPVKFNGSGDFASLGKSDGFIELPQNKESFLNGEVYPLHLWTL